MKVVVCAHGDGRRWDTDGGPYLGHPKQLCRFDGQTLLERTVQLFAERGADVVIVAPDARFDVASTPRVTVDGINGCGSDMGKFVDTAHLWSTTERTVIVWGDCWYSDALADRICSHQDGRYHVWRRPGPSTVTGAPWDESFAVSFGPEEHGRVLDVARRVAGYVRDGRLRASHIRTHLAAMCGQPLEQLDNVRATAALPNQTHVDDWSDDFDTPAEWRGWVGRRYAGRYDVAVCIPWCGGDPWRTASYQWVRAWYEALGLAVYVGDDHTAGRWPNRSAMRNDAARQAAAAGHEAFLFADADTFVAADQLWAATHLALDRRRFTLAFRTYVRCSRTVTERHRRPGAVDGRLERRLQAGAYQTDGHASCAHVVPADLFAELGGYDERFTRWGFEDRAFWLSALVLGDGAEWVDGTAWHWWHPTADDKDRRSAEYEAGAELGRRYKHAAAWAPKAGAMHPIDLPAGAVADRDALRAILAEPGGPLSSTVAV